MFGLFKQDPEKHRARAETLFAEGDPGSAKLEFEKALDATPESETSARESIAERIDLCCDTIAENRLREAGRLIGEGNEELAREEIAGAMEVAASDSVKADAQRLLDSLEGREALALEDTSALGDEEVLALLSGSWEEAQHDEYAAYPDAFYDALVALQRNDDEESSKSAQLTLEGLVADRPEAKFLHFEIARARARHDDLAGAKESLETFLAAIEGLETKHAELVARVELATLRDRQGDFKGALESLQKSCEEFDDDYRSYFALGAFLRAKGHAEQAVEVLEEAADLLDELRPDWQVLQELGLALADAKRTSDAIERLESVVQFFVDRHRANPGEDTTPPIPTTSGERLALLHEEGGKLDRAADLYATLARGVARDRHPHYEREAARVLAKLELGDQARKHLKRAQALLTHRLEASEDADVRSEISAQLVAVENELEAL